MSLSPAGEASVVTEKRPKSDRPATRATAKAAKTAKTPAAKPAATPRKRTPPAKRPWPVVEPVVEAVVEPVTEPIAEPVTEAAVEAVIDLGPEPAAPLRAERPRRRHGSGLARGAVVLVAVAAAAALVIAVRWDSSPEPTRATPVAMSPANLLSLAESRDTPIYWAGPFAGRELELTTTTTGTFVRYLPAGATSGNTKLALTIATYPLQGAYATAVQQANEKGMTSEQTENGGLAVWRASKPTSVYVAFRGVPSLVEVYAPAAKEARTLALSGRIKPVR
jgi:ribonuclease E